MSFNDGCVMPERHVRRSDALGAADPGGPAVIFNTPDEPELRRYTGGDNRVHNNAALECLSPGQAKLAAGQHEFISVDRLAQKKHSSELGGPRYPGHRRHI